MLARLVTLVVLCAVAWAPVQVLADEPQVASSGSSDTCRTVDAACVPSAGDNGASDADSPRFIPSRPSEIAQGHEDQSSHVLVILGLAGFAGLVVSVLHRLSLED